MMMITWEPPETPNGQVTVRTFHGDFRMKSRADVEIVRASGLIEFSRKVVRVQMSVCVSV